MRQFTIPLPDGWGEAQWFAGCMLLAVGLNIYGIVTFKTPWSELITSLPWVVALAAMFYLLAVLARLIALGVRRLRDRSFKLSNTGTDNE